MKTKALCIGCLLAALVCARPAHAAVIMTLEQVGLNVVATASGTVNLTGLSLTATDTIPPYIEPDQAVLTEGKGGIEDVKDVYYGISGPANFGTGAAGTYASTGNGDPLGITRVAGKIEVPHNYVSGTQLSSNATWDNTTLAALGVTDGIYTWTWGSGANADSLTLYAGVPTPEPAPALLLTLGAAGLALLKRIKK